MADLTVYGELHLGDQKVLEVYLGEECVYEFRNISSN